MSTPIPRNRAAISAEGVHAIGIFTDSRAVVPGSAFVALRAERDGHAYVADAIARGASIVVIENGHDAPGATIKVPDTLAALGDLAREHLRAWRRERKDARTIFITGSAGKTTTKQIVSALLETVGPTLATPGNLNNRIGLPMVAFCVENGHRFAVLEAGMSVPNEIATLASIAEADGAIITNIGVAHAEGVGGTREDVAREKYAALSADRIAIINADEPIFGPLPPRTITFGLAASANVRLVSRESLGVAGSRMTVSRAGETFTLDLPLLGEAAAIDFVAALASVDAILESPLSAQAMKRAMQSLQNVDGRMTPVRLMNGTLILDDSYNANPHSMRASLGVLADIRRAEQRRAVAVLGEMKELGESSVREHEALGPIIDASAEVVIGCGGAIDHALASLSHAAVYRAADVSEAASLAKRLILPGDVVLIKASRSVGAERIVAALRDG